MKAKITEQATLQSQMEAINKAKEDEPKKVKDLADELSGAHTDLWQTNNLLGLTQNQLEASELSLKVALKCGALKAKMTSVASATIATLRDESTQELNQARNIIDAQKLENLALVQELLNLKIEISSLKAQAAKPARQGISSTPSTLIPTPSPSNPYTKMPELNDPLPPLETPQQHRSWESQQ